MGGGPGGSAPAKLMRLLDGASGADLRRSEFEEIAENLSLEDVMAVIDQIAADEFDGSAYEDEVRARVRAAIEQKIEGEEITATIEEEPKAQIVDLMAALKASLGVDEEKAAPKKAKAKAKKRAPARKAAKKAAPRKKAAAK